MLANSRISLAGEQHWRSHGGWGGGSGCDTLSLQFLSFSCSFLEKWQIMGFIPPLGGVPLPSHKSWIRHWIELHTKSCYMGKPHRVDAPFSDGRFVLQVWHVVPNKCAHSFNVPSLIRYVTKIRIDRNTIVQTNLQVFIFYLGNLCSLMFRTLKIEMK